MPSMFWIAHLDKRTTANSGTWPLQKILVLISKDEDFFNLANRPEEIGYLIWLRLGNSRKQPLLTAFENAWSRIETALLDWKLTKSATLGAVLDELKKIWPTLRGTFRESQTGKRRALVRYFACQEDWSHEPLETLLPMAVRSGRS